MSDHYDNLGFIRRTEEPSSSGITVPPEVVEGTPYRICNQLVDDVFFVSGSSCFRDTTTGILLLDSRDYVVAAPTSEEALRTTPAVMRVITAAGAITTGAEFIIDYRHIGYPRTVDLARDGSLDCERFEEYQARNGTVLPAAALFNMGGETQYVGPESLLPEARYLMNTVDHTLATTKLTPFVHAIRRVVPEPDYTPMSVATEQPEQSAPAELNIIASEVAKPTGLLHSLVGLAGSLAALEAVSALTRRQHPKA